MAFQWTLKVTDSIGVMLCWTMYSILIWMEQMFEQSALALYDIHSQ